MTDAEKRDLSRHMRTPCITFAALMLMLGAIVTLGWLQPFPAAWAIVGALMVVMIVVVLLFSMEVIEDPPLIKFFSALGFIWVGILFTMTMVDYATR